MTTVETCKAFGETGIYASPAIVINVCQLEINP